MGNAVTATIGPDAPAVSTAKLTRYCHTRRAPHGLSFLFTAETDGAFTVRADALEFDAYLVVEEIATGAMVEAGPENGTLEARVAVAGREAHEYRITVAACDAATGTFAVQVTAAAEPIPDDAAARLRAHLEQCRATEGKASVSAASAQLRLGAMLHDLGRVAEGQAEIAAALQLREQLLPADDPAIGDALNGLIDCLLVGDQLEAAEPLIERLVKMRVTSSGADSYEASVAFVQLALLRHRQGRYVEAERDYQRALAIAERALPGNHLHIASIARCLGVLRAELGAFEAARRDVERALRIEREQLGPDASRVGESLNMLGLILIQQRLYSQARAPLEQALQILTQRPAHARPPLDTVRNNLGHVAYSLGAPEEALTHYAEALRIAEAQGESNLRTVAMVLNNRAAACFSQRRYEDAREDLERSLAIRERSLGLDHPDVLSTLNNLAAVLRACGKYEASTSLHERVMKLTESLLGPDHPDTALQLSNLSFVIESTDPERALALAARSVAIRRKVLAHQLPVLSENERLSLAAALRFSLDHVLALASRHPHAISTADVYTEVLAWKGQVSRGLFQERAWLQQHTDPQTIERLGHLQEVLGQMSRALFGNNGLRADRDAAQLERLVSERSELERELADSDRLAPLATPVTLASLVAQLAPSDALVDYLIYQHAELASTAAGMPGSQRRVVAFVTRHDGVVRSIDLGAAEPIERALDAHLHLTARRVDATDDALALPYSNAVRDLVWQPLEPALRDATRIFVSPDGALGTLPFETLASDARHFLIEDHQFVYLESALDLLAPAPQANGTGFLLAGGIDYDGGHELAAAEPALRGFHTPLKPLPATLPEVRELAALWLESAGRDGPPALVLTGTDATEPSVKQQASRRRFLHLAAHGFAAAEDARSKFADAIEGELSSRVKELTRHARDLHGQLPGLMSGVALAGANRVANGADDDGILTAEEAAWLDLRGCELVTLSACDTGLGTPRAGESLLGLRRAFRLAGAKTTITALWRVADDATRELMVAFYQHLWRDHLPKGEALRRTQLEILQKNRVRHDGRGLPGTWGSFLLEGDWR